MIRVRHLIGLVLALGTLDTATAAPQLTTEDGIPLPEPFQRAMPGAGTTVSAIYKAAVFEHLAAAIRAEGPKGVPGVARIHFVIAGDGALLRINVTQSSGDAAFDARAIAMVRRAAPFPPPPPAAKREFDATIRFDPNRKS